MELAIFAAVIVTIVVFCCIRVGAQSENPNEFYE